MDHYLRPSRAAVAAAVLFVAVGCTSPPSETSMPAGGAAASGSRPAAGTIDRALLRSGYGGLDFRYITYEDSAELLDSPAVDLALTAEVRSFESGPRLASGEIGSVVMRVVATERFENDLDAGRELGVLLPEFGLTQPASDRGPEALARAIPVGTEVALFLSEGADLPPDAPTDLYTANSPQGFAVADGDTTLYPLDSELDSDESLDVVLEPISED